MFSVSDAPKKGSSNWRECHNHLEAMGPTPIALDSAGLRWGLGICISDELPGEAGAALPGITL